MSMRDDLPISVTHEVRDRCLCFQLQRAARLVARRFDDALRPFGLTNGQFSLLMSLNRPLPPRICDISPFLAMDRTTLSANLKPLERRGLVAVVADEKDGRSRRLTLTDKGRDALVAAVPVWRRTHDEVDKLFSASGPDHVRRELGRLK